MFIAAMANVTKYQLALLLQESPVEEHKKVAQTVLTGLIKGKKNNASPNIKLGTIIKRERNLVFPNSKQDGNSEVYDKLRKHICTRQETIIEIPEEPLAEDKKIKGCENIEREENYHQGQNALYFSDESDKESDDDDDENLLEYIKNVRQKRRQAISLLQELDKSCIVSFHKVAERDNEYSPGEDDNGEDGDSEEDEDVVEQDMLIEIQHEKSLKRKADIFETKIERAMISQRKRFNTIKNQIKACSWSECKDWMKQQRECMIIFVFNETRCVWMEDALYDEKGKKHSSVGNWIQSFESKDGKNILDCIRVIIKTKDAEESMLLGELYEKIVDMRPA